MNTNTSSTTSNRLVDDLSRLLHQQGAVLEKRVQAYEVNRGIAVLGIIALPLFGIVGWIETKSITGTAFVLVLAALLSAIIWGSSFLVASRQLRRFWTTVWQLDSAGFFVYRPCIRTLWPNVTAIGADPPDLTDEYYYFVQYKGQNPPTLGNFVLATNAHSQPMLLTSSGLIPLMLKPTPKLENA